MIDEKEARQQLERAKRLLDRGKFSDLELLLAPLQATGLFTAEVSGLLTEAERRKMILGISASPELAIRALSCPSCGATLSRRHDSAQTICCHACGTLVDTTVEPFSILSADQKGYKSPRSFIALGQTATFSDGTYEVVARMICATKMREWDSDDDKYYNEIWTYDEWLLQSEHGGYIFLCEDAEGYSVARKYTPKFPRIPASSDGFLSFDQPQNGLRIVEIGTITINYIEGELPWVPDVEDSINYAEYLVPPTRFAVEWITDKESGETKEVEFFRSSPVGKRELLVALNLQEELEKLDREEFLAKQYRRWGGKFLLLAGCLLFLGVIFANFGSPVFRTSVVLSDLNQDGVTLGPFTLSKVGRVHELGLISQIPKNQESWVGVELVDSANQVINAVEGDFWHESGRDSDGYWEESDTSESVYFRLENPGDYFIRIFPDEGKIPQGQMTVEVYESVFLLRYFALAALVALAYGASLFFYQSVNPLLIVFGVFAVGVFIFKNFEAD